jgi:hypothetical protein
VFTDGPGDENGSGNVARDLMLISEGTMVVHEARIARLIGLTTLS